MPFLHNQKENTISTSSSFKPLYCLNLFETLVIIRVSMLTQKLERSWVVSWETVKMGLPDHPAQLLKNFNDPTDRIIVVLHPTTINLHCCALLKLRQLIARHLVIVNVPAPKRFAPAPPQPTIYKHIIE